MFINGVMSRTGRISTWLPGKKAVAPFRSTVKPPFTRPKITPVTRSLASNDFSRTVELLIANEDFLETEIMRINALNPSVQRIILGADEFLKDKNYVKVNSELERALRLTKTEGALYLRIAHLRYKQGLLRESESFASRGLLLSNISSWERLLLNVYLKT